MADRCCVLCGWTIYNDEDPEGVSWSNQFRASESPNHQHAELFRDITTFSDAFLEKFYPLMEAVLP